MHLRDGYSLDKITLNEIEEKISESLKDYIFDPKELCAEEIKRNLEDKQIDSILKNKRCEALAVLKRAFPEEFI